MTGHDSEPRLTNQDEFRFLADLVLKQSTGEQTFIALQDANRGTTRFANNQIIQNLNTHRASVAITVAFGNQHGTASTTDLTAGAVQDTLRRAERIAKVSPPDPEYVPVLPHQSYASFPTFRSGTLSAGPTGRLAQAQQAIKLCQAEDLLATGVVSSSGAVIALAANTGLFAYEQRTEAHFSVTAISENSTGWASTAHRSIDELGIEERTRVAIGKAKQSSNPQELPAGRYTVVLEPAAVAGLFNWFIWMLDAKSYYKNTSPFSGKLGKQVVDQRLTLRNRPDHPQLLGNGFTSEGLPGNARTWFEAGVLKELAYDRFTAKEHRIENIATLDALYLSGDSASGSRVEDLIQSTQHGILVTNFWYIRSVNATDLTLTGMTRDGTFLIENGQVTTALRNFRFHESPLLALNQLEAFTTPVEATTSESAKMLVPAMKIRDFNFSSVTRF